MMHLKRDIFAYLLIAAIAIGLGTYFRLYPRIHAGEQDARNLASMVVFANLRQKIQQIVEVNYPTLADTEKIQLADRNMKELITDNRRRVAAMVEEGVRALQLSRPKDTVPFLLEADSYYFYGLTENIRDFGRLSAQVRHGKYFNPLILAPNGNWQPFTLHPYIGYLLYKSVSLFRPDVTMISAVMYTVILLAALCVIPFLLICWLLRLRPLAASIGCAFFILAPFFAQRTAYGWYDTDAYNVLLPLAVFAFIFAGLDAARPAKARMGLIVAAAFFTGVYSLFWEGWGFLPVVMLISLPTIAVANLLMFKTWRANGALGLGAAYVLGSLVWVGIFGTPYAIIDTFSQSWKMLSSFLAANFEVWPNIFLTVGETQAMTMPKVSFLVFGNTLLVYAALLGPLALLVGSFRRKDTLTLYRMIPLIIFTLSFLYLSLRAARNAVLLIAPLTIALAISVELTGRLYRTLSAPLFKKLSPRLARWVRPAVGAILSIACLSITAMPINAAYQICSRIYPIYNRTWEKVLTQLKKETPENSIINTWWCPGHFITAVAKRGATVDGATQHLPQTYWIATILMSTDEKTALGLLRMLNSSGNNALDYLVNTCRMHTSDAINLLKEIAPLDAAEAAQVFQKRLKKTDADTLLRLTKGNPPPSYLLIYNDLVDTYLALPYIGNWDFKKAELLVTISKDPKQKVKIPSRSSKGYIDFLWSLTGGVPPVSPQYPEIYRTENIVLFENRFVVELNSMESFLLSPDGKKFVNPKSLIYVKGDDYKEKVYEGQTLPFSLMLLHDEKTGKYTCIMLDRAVATSLLFRLYYLNGKGLTAFKHFLREDDSLTKTDMIVYRIDWGAVAP